MDCILAHGGTFEGCPDCRGQTPLHAACFQGSTKIAKHLLARGADISAKTTMDGIPDRPTCLHIAAYYNYEALADVGGACAQWDAVPTLGKLQILGAVGLLEIWSECSGTHYMAPGGKPGCVAPSAPHSEKRAHSTAQPQGRPCLSPPSILAAAVSALVQLSRDAVGQGVGLGLGQGHQQTLI